MARFYTFPVTIVQEADGVFMARFPDLPEALTFGATEDEAAAEAVDCLREALRARMRDGENIPPPSEGLQGARAVAAPAETAAKAAVYEAFRERGITRVALADRLGVNESEVRRILDPGHRTKLERLEQAAAALGGRLEVSFVPSKR